MYSMHPSLCIAICIENTGIYMFLCYTYTAFIAYLVNVQYNGLHLNGSSTIMATSKEKVQACLGKENLVKSQPNAKRRQKLYICQMWVNHEPLNSVFKTHWNVQSDISLKNQTFSVGVLKVKIVFFPLRGIRKKIKYQVCNKSTEVSPRASEQWKCHYFLNFEHFLVVKWMGCDEIYNQPTFPDHQSCLVHYHTRSRFPLMIPLSGHLNRSRQLRDLVFY